MVSKNLVRQESTLETFEFLIDSNVWVKSDHEQLFTLGVIKSVGNNSLSVEVNGITKDYPFSDCLNALCGYNVNEVDDLVKIPHSNSAIVIDLLRDRFAKDKIYVGKFSLRHTLARFCWR